MSECADEESAKSLLASAESALQLEDHEEALRQSLKANEWYRKHDEAGSADVLRVIVQSYRLRALDTLEDAQRRAAFKEAEDIVAEEMAKFSQKGLKRSEAIMLLTLADVFYDQKGYDKAANCKESAEKALAIARELSDKLLEANALLSLVYGHARLGEGKQASAVVEEAMALFKDSGDVLGQARCLHAKAALLEGLRQDGILVACEAVSLLRTTSNRRMLASELHTIAQWYLWNHKPRDALPFAMEAAMIFHEIEGFGTSRANAMSTAIKCLVGKEDFDEALKLSLKALERSRKENDLRAQIVCLNTLVATQVEQDCNCCYPGNFDEALKAAEEAVDLCRSISNENWEAHMTRSVAIVNMHLKSFDNASASARSSIAMFRKLGDREEEAIALRTLVDVHIDTKNYDAAITVAGEMVALWQDVQNKSKEAGALLLVADINNMLMRRKKYILGNPGVDAMSAATAALSIYQEEGDMRMAISTWSFIAKFQCARGNLQDAVQAAETAAELSEKDGDFRMQARYLALAAGFLVEEHPGAATSIVENALKAARASKSSRLEVEMLVLVSQIYAAKASKDLLLADENSRDVVWTKSEPRALRTAREAMMLARKLKGKHCLPAAQYALGEVHLLGGKGEECLRLAKEATAGFAGLHEHHSEATSLLLEAEAHYACGRATEATNLARNAQQRFKDLDDDKGQARAEDALKRFAAIATKGNDQEKNGSIAGALAASAAMPQLQTTTRRQLDPEHVLNVINQVATEFVDADIFSQDDALMDMGVDSLSVVPFKNSLSEKFDIRMPASLIFDYPSIRQLKEFIIEESQA